MSKLIQDAFFLQWTQNNYRYIQVYSCKAFHRCINTHCLTDFYMEMSKDVSLLRTAQSLLTGRTIPTTYISENKINYLEVYTLSCIMSIVFASFKHLKLPISIKIHVTLLHIIYICMTAVLSNFQFMNYFFANLVVVCNLMTCKLYVFHRRLIRFCYDKFHSEHVRTSYAR